MYLEEFIYKNRLEIQINCSTEGCRSIAVAIIVGTDAKTTLDLIEAFGGWQESCSLILDLLAHEISGKILSNGLKVPKLEVSAKYQKYLDERGAWIQGLCK